MSLLNSVLPAARKETGWWTENIVSSPHHVSLVGYALKYFKELDAAMAPNARAETEHTAECHDSVLANQASRSSLWGRRALTAPASDDKTLSGKCNLITGEATPAMLYWQHHGMILLPRWMRCIHPQARLIVTLRDPIQRTYSDFLFFGRLQATKGNVGRGNDARIRYVRALTPETFHDAMEAEIKSLEQCFSRNSDDDDGLSLLWDPPDRSDCDAIRKDQLSLLGFQSRRLPGRLLMSLYPMHMASWLRFFPCDQLLVVRSNGHWGEPTMRAIATFLSVDPESARKAAAAEAVRPEQFAYNKEAFALAAAAAAPPGISSHHRFLSSGSARNKPWPMLNHTRVLLGAFFEAHWSARFPLESDQTETCGA